MKAMRNLTFVILAVLFLTALGAVASAQDDNTTTTTVGTTNTSGTSTSTITNPDASTTPAVDTGRPRLAVHTFENPPNYYNSTIGNGLTSIIITNIAQSGRFDVIQRGDNLELLVDEIKLGQSGYIEPDSAVEMGHILGVDYILSGQVTNFGYEEQSAGGFLGGWGAFGGLDVNQQEAVVRLDFALIDATTGTTVLAATAEGKESDTGVAISGGDWSNWVGSINFDSQEFMDSMVGHATLKAVNNLMDQILALFPVQAPILAVLPNAVIIDIGSGMGIEAGMEFDVYRVTAITNSAGALVWQDRTLIGKVRVTEVELTGAKAEIISGSGFMEGDICILPEDEQTVETSAGRSGNPHR